ncbi:kelch-like protein 15 [Amphiura filiformis]|uniref:kelch-like protein 15 n=1 Tax=Amphiura filiformis TaxID=82378 RepID=UPI003B227313
MFTSGFSEGTANEVNIDGKPEIFEVLLEHVYTGKLTMSILTAYEILAMASYMQFTDALKICKEYIKRQVKRWSPTPDKIPIGDIYQISQLPICQGEFLAKRCEVFMCRHFKILKTSDVFLEAASEEFLKHFLELTDLAEEDTEKEVLELVVKWLKFDWDKRCTHAASLLGSVRLGLVPEEDLQELLDDDIRSIKECEQLLTEMQEGNKLGLSKFKLSGKMPQHFATRSTITAPVTFCGYFKAEEGGISTTTNSSFYYFDKRSKCWKDNLTYSFVHIGYLPSLIVVDEDLYAVGGLEQIAYDGYSMPMDNFCVYVPEQNEWKNLPSMKNPRSHVQVAHLDGFIYALGGLECNDLSSSVERFDLAKEEWQELASLPCGFHCVAATAYHGNIITYCKQFVDGPFSGVTGGCISVYSPDHNTWHVDKDKDKLGDDMPEPRLFQHEDQLYRVKYEKPEDQNSAKMYEGPSEYQPVVNKVRVERCEANDMTVSMGDEVSQDLIPANAVCAFRIEDDVFINTEGFVIKTDIKVDKDQSVNVDLQEWKAIALEEECGGIANFTFDPKKLQCIPDIDESEEDTDLSDGRSDTGLCEYDESLDSDMGSLDYMYFWG